MLIINPKQDPIIIALMYVFDNNSESDKRDE